MGIFLAAKSAKDYRKNYRASRVAIPDCRDSRPTEVQDDLVIINDHFDYIRIENILLHTNLSGKSGNSGCLVLETANYLCNLLWMNKRLITLDINYDISSLTEGILVNYI